MTKERMKLIVNIILLTPKTKELLVVEKRRFIRGFVAHLLSYGLGRELSPADSPALDAITENAMKGGRVTRTGPPGRLVW